MDRRVKPRTILEYLSHEMTTEELNQLYQDKFTVLTLFRTLPPLSKQYIMRFVTLQPLTPIPRSTIRSWHVSFINKQASPINNDSLQVLINLKLLVKIQPSSTQQHYQTYQTTPHQNTDTDIFFSFNPFFHKSLQSALATTNPLQLHLSPFILPRLLSKLQEFQSKHTISSLSSLSSTSINTNFSQDSAQSIESSTSTSLAPKSSPTKSTATSALVKLRFKKREPAATTTTSTTTNSASPPAQIFNDGEKTVSNKDSKSSKFQQQQQQQRDIVNFAVPLPPVCIGDTNSLLEHITCNTTKTNTITTITSKLPLLDVSFLDTFANDQINHISLYLFQLLTKSSQSLVYPALTTHPTSSSSTLSTPASTSIGGRINCGVTTFLIDILWHNNFISSQRINNRTTATITKEGLAFTLKPAQDRAWVLLLMYFDSIRSANKRSLEALQTSSVSTIATVESKTTPLPLPSSTSVPSLSNVFQFIFHLSFAPLGTSIPVLELHSDQLIVLFHLAEFGFLYPLYSTQIPAPPQPLSSTVSISPELTHGLLGFYPTRLLTNLSSSLKSTTFISLSDLALQNSNVMEDFDDELQSVEQIVASSSLTSKSPSGHTSTQGVHNGPIAASISSATGQLSITEKAYNELIQDLSTPAGTASNPLKRFLVVETTLKVYAFTNNPLYLKILSHFVEFQVKLPNLCVGFITRHSVQKAIGMGISSEEIVSWLTQHAHERMIRNAMGEFDSALQRYKNNRDIILPLTVVNQISIWATEQDRFICHDAIMLAFKDHTTYHQWKQKILQFEIELKLRQLPPNRRPKTDAELELVNFDSIILEPSFLLLEPKDKPTLIIHSKYYDEFRVFGQQQQQQQQQIQRQIQQQEAANVQ